MKQKLVFYMMVAALAMMVAGCNGNKDDIDRIDAKVNDIGGRLDDVGKAIDGINGRLDQPVPTFKVGTDAGNDAVFVRGDTAIALQMPDGFKEADYTAIEARIRNGQYSSSDVKVRSAAQAWGVTVNRPTFIGGRYNNDASVGVSLPQGAKFGDTAILEVSLVGNDGTSTTAKRALVNGRVNGGDSVIDLRNTQWELEKLVDMETGGEIIPIPKYNKDGGLNYYLEIGSDAMMHFHIGFVQYDFDRMSLYDERCGQEIYNELEGNGNLILDAFCGCCAISGRRVEPTMEIGDGYLKILNKNTNKIFIFKLIRQ